MVFHVSSAAGAEVLRRARGEGQRIYAETCPQYLFMTAADLDRPGLEGAKFMCSPPPRDAADQEALWRALALGDLQTVTSDHAPYRYDATGKLAAGPDATFKQIANGLPGLQVRLPLLFDAMVTRGRLGLDAFVDLTATSPARIYNLAGKGAIVPGADADIAIWNPEHRVTLADALMRDNAGYTPYAGRTVTGWPEKVFLRGRLLVDGDTLTAAPGSGRFLARNGGAAAAASGRLVAEIDPMRNFGARLL
jgi:dihydropyrimidinase